MILLANKVRIPKSKTQRLKIKLIREMDKMTVPHPATMARLTQVRPQMVAKMMRVRKSQKLILSSKRASKHASLPVASSVKVSHLTRRMPASTYASTSVPPQSNL